MNWRRLDLGCVFPCQEEEFRCYSIYRKDYKDSTDKRIAQFAAERSAFKEPLILERLARINDCSVFVSGQTEWGVNMDDYVGGNWGSRFYA